MGAGEMVSESPASPSSRSESAPNLGVVVYKESAGPTPHSKTCAHRVALHPSVSVTLRLTPLSGEGTPSPSDDLLPAWPWTSLLPSPSTAGTLWPRCFKARGGMREGRHTAKLSVSHPILAPSFGLSNLSKCPASVHSMCTVPSPPPSS